MTSIPLFFFISPLLLVNFNFISCQYVKETHKYEEGKQYIKEGVTSANSLLYWGKVTGRALMSDKTLGKEICYPNSADNKIPNEPVKIKGYEVKSYEKENEPITGVVFHSRGGVNDDQVCFYFLTKPDGNLHYFVYVYGTRDVPLNKLPRIPVGQIQRQRMGEEMFQEHYERPPITVPEGSKLKDTFGKPKTHGGGKGNGGKPRRQSLQE